MFNIKIRVVLASTVIFGAFLVIIGILALRDLRRDSYKLLDSQIRSLALVIKDRVEINSEDKSQMHELEKLLMNELGDAKFQIFDETGKRLIADTIFSSKSFSNIIWQSSFAGVSEISDMEISGEKYRCLITPVKLNESPKAILVLAASLWLPVTHNEQIHLFWFLIVVPLFLSIMIYVTYRLSKNAFLPVVEMVNSVKEITATSLDKRLVIPKAKDEIRLLGETMNDMIERISNGFKSQKRFIADATHEIKTPLTVIQAELELAEMNTKESDTKESIKIALSEIERLNTLSNSLLTLAKLDASPHVMHYSLVRLDELVVECNQVMKRIAQSQNIELCLSVSDIIELQADREKLKSVVINLLDNAVKFSNANSRIELSLEKDLSSVVLKIKDYGCGIHEKELPHIFKRFYRSNETRGKIPGSGLGLSLADEIVKMHKGTISVESQLGVGTTFTVRFAIR